MTNKFQNWKLEIRNSKFSSGFTLIELLIVIAVLGILAVVVLVALDPLEQIARGRDTGRINSVAELGHAMEAYAVNSGGSYPAPGTTWQNAMIAAGEIKRLVTVPDNNATVCASAYQQGNVCYYSTGVGSTQTAVIWTTLESKSTKSKANPNATSTGGCASGTWVAVWSSAQGKAGIACAATATPPDAINTYLN